MIDIATFTVRRFKQNNEVTLSIMEKKKLSRGELMDKISNSDSPLLVLFNNFFGELELLEDEADDMTIDELTLKAREFQESFLEIVESVKEVLEDNDIDLDTLKRG